MAQRGRPKITGSDKVDQRFQFVFSKDQVEIMGGRKEVLKFVKETITKEIWTRKTQSSNTLGRR